MEKTREQYTTTPELAILFFIFHKKRERTFRKRGSKCEAGLLPRLDAEEDSMNWKCGNVNHTSLFLFYLECCFFPPQLNIMGNARPVWRKSCRNLWPWREKLGMFCLFFLSLSFLSLTLKSTNCLTFDLADERRRDDRGGERWRVLEMEQAGKQA